MDIDDSSDSSLPVIGLKNVKAVEYDPISHMIYWVSCRIYSRFLKKFAIVL